MPIFTITIVLNICSSVLAFRLEVVNPHTWSVFYYFLYQLFNYSEDSASASQEAGGDGGIHELPPSPLLPECLEAEQLLCVERMRRGGRERTEWEGKGNCVHRRQTHLSLTCGIFFLSWPTWRVLQLCYAVSSRRLGREGKSKTKGKGKLVHRCIKPFSLVV